MGEVKIYLTGDLFYGGGVDYPYTINVNPKYTRWDDRKSIPTNTNGVYVVFDFYSGDYHTPNSKERFSKNKSCVYVGEGNIRTRLNTHDNTARLGKFAFDVVYYEVSDQIERKLLERVLIRHYKPLLNKEKDLYNAPQEKQKIMQDMSKRRKRLLNHIKFLKSYLEISTPTYKEMTFDDILDELLKNKSFDVIEDNIRRKKETLGRIYDIKPYWVEDKGSTIPDKYRTMNPEMILHDLLLGADDQIEIIEEDMIFALDKYINPDAYSEHQYF